MYKFILLARLLVTMYNHADAPRITLCNLLTDRKYIHVSECIIVLWQGVDEQQNKMLKQENQFCTSNQYIVIEINNIYCAAAI